MSQGPVEQQAANGSPKAGSRRRMTRLLLIAMAFVAFLYGFKYFWLEHPVGAGPAGPQVSREQFEELWSDRDIILVGFGDSVTAGLGAQPASNSYNFEDPNNRGYDAIRRLFLIEIAKYLPQRLSTEQ